MTDLIRWDPFRSSISLHDVMERAFDESFVRSLNPWLFKEGERRSLAVDMCETDDSLEVKASLPGIKPEDVDISVIDNTLRIKGETKVEEERKETGKYHYRERHYGAFQRTITLPMGKHRRGRSGHPGWCAETDLSQS